MKKLNFQFGLILLATLLMNPLFAQNKKSQSKEKKVILTKKTVDKNGQERVETITQKDGKTDVNVTIDGETVPNESLNGEELIVFKNKNKTYFLREIEEDVIDNLELAFEGLELKLNNLNFSDVQLGVAQDDANNGDEGSLGVELKEVQTKNKDEITKQVKVVRVLEASAAEEAGLQVGDIITTIDGKNIRSLTQTMHLIKANAPGETIAIEYIRNGEKFQTTATLQDSKDSNTLIFGGGDTRIEWDENGQIRWNGDEDFTIKFPMFENKGEMGVTLGDVTDEGILITQVQPESAAAEAGLLEGDIITEINGQQTNTTADLLETLKGKKAGESIDVGYIRDGQMNNTTVTLKKSDNIFLFKSGNQEIKWEDNRNDWNFGWIENEGNTSMGVIFGTELENGIEINGIIDNSGAAEAGLESGDIITAINGQAVNSTEGIQTILSEQNAGDGVTVTYLRDTVENTVTVVLGTKKLIIRKPKNLDVFFGDSGTEAKMEAYEDVETPVVAEADRLEFSQLDMFPNPNQGAFTLSFEIQPGATSIVIHNEAEEVVYENKMPNFKGVFSDRIDISEQPSGVYFLTIMQGDKKIIKKVIYN